MLELIKIMRTPEERSAGLNALPINQPLGSNQAMLFIFPKDTDSSFWNRGVKYAIDVAFFDKNKRLLSVSTLKADQTQPVFCLLGHYRYVLETTNGFFRNNKIQPGTILDQLITKEK